MKRQPALLPIHIYGDRILRLKAEEVAGIDDELKSFAADLAHTMYLRDGVGLAAPQVGVSRRVIAIDPYWARDGNKKNPVVMVNPSITASSGESETEEGCISLPGLYGYVTRPSQITVEYTDLEGQRVTVELSGYAATVVQHEFDHLEGVLFVDRVNAITKLKLKRKLKEMEKAAVDGINIRNDAVSED